MRCVFECELLSGHVIRFSIPNRQSTGCAGANRQRCAVLSPRRAVWPLACGSCLCYSLLCLRPLSGAFHSHRPCRWSLILFDRVATQFVWSGISGRGLGEENGGLQMFRTASNLNSTTLAHETN